MNNMKHYLETYKYYVVGVGVIILGVFIWFLRSSLMMSTHLTPQHVQTTATVLEVTSTTEKYVYVDIKGMVKRPGVYKVLSDTRVKDVIALAEGFLEHAKIDVINLAQSVYDEMVIIVPSKESEIESAINTSKININTATKEQLLKLKGIGESKADAILGYRKEKGKITTLDELTQIKGISKRLLDDIRSEVIVR